MPPGNPKPQTLSPIARYISEVEEPSTKECFLQVIGTLDIFCARLVLKRQNVGFYPQIPSSRPCVGGKLRSLHPPVHRRVRHCRPARHLVVSLSLGTLIGALLSVCPEGDIPAMMDPDSKAHRDYSIYSKPCTLNHRDCSF